MTRKEKVNEWLQFAEEDLAIAKTLLQDKRKSANIVYHLHQCIEKSLKAYLIANYQQVGKIHPLIQLLELCLKVDSGFNSLINLVADFSNGNDCRYPNSDAICSADVKTITELVQLTEVVNNYILSKIEIK
jgi:hypothetical protein